MGLKWMEKEKLPTSLGMTRLPKGPSGNLVGPWRLALPLPTPGWGRGLARVAGCSGSGCQHSPLNSTHSG